uniref:T9SS type A sorting domain-containing protein n=1 Tax=Rhodohalobacter sp. TaxID=1974210 RepID=UPI003561BE21
GVELTDQPEIVFEEVEIGIPVAPVLTAVSAVDGGAVINWSVSSVDFIDRFLLYRGDSVQNLTVIDELNSGIRSYTDQNPLEGTAVYTIAAVNSNGEQSAPSNTLLFVNSEVVASTEWQLVSIPLLEETSEMELATIYSFSDRYDLNTSFEPGKGYWVKTKTFDEERLPASGPGLDSLTIQLNAGWNLIGSLSVPTPILSISDPNEILTETPVYLYRDSNYQVTNELLPNFGHWIYARENGGITITVKNDPPVAGLEMSNSEMVSNDSNKTESEMATIEFRQGDYSAEIFASQSYLSESEQHRYLLPPVSPAPKLDVRINNKSSLINSEPSKIQITAKQYPIEIKLDGQDENSDYAYRLHAEKEGKSRTIDLIPGKTEILNQEYDSIEVEMIHADEAVTENQLKPNYPNPFNPTTTIQYQLREQTHVMIEVYDVIGRRIQLLANETQLSGQHRVNFDGTNLSSGLYFIRFQAGDVVDIRKMTLIK